MKREPVFEGELEGASVSERLAALRQMYASPNTAAPPPRAIEPVQAAVPKPLIVEVSESESPSGFRMMVCNWPGKVIRTGEASGVRYVFEDGKEVPVDIRDVDQLLRVVRATGGCCGHAKRKVQVFAYA